MPTIHEDLLTNRRTFANTLRAIMEAQPEWGPKPIDEYMTYPGIEDLLYHQECPNLSLLIGKTRWELYFSPGYSEGPVLTAENTFERYSWDRQGIDFAWSQIDYATAQAMPDDEPEPEYVVIVQVLQVDQYGEPTNTIEDYRSSEASRGTAESIYHDITEHIRTKGLFA